MKKTEEMIYQEVVDYINATKHNKPCMLQSIKKDLRTKKVIGLIFSRPDIFKLDIEFPFIPEDYMNEEFIKKLLLHNPTRINFMNDKKQYLIKDEYLTYPVLLAFYISKYIYEYKDRIRWGIYSEKINYNRKILGFEKQLISDADKLINKILFENNEDIFRLDEDKILYYLDEYLSTIEIPKYKDDEYIKKYSYVKFELEKPLLILINGMPDSGKSKIANELSYVIGGFHIDTDRIVERPNLNDIVDKYHNVIILSDTYAFHFFSEKEMENFEVINIIVKPISIEKLHRNSKYLSCLELDIHKKNELDKFIHRYDHLENPIIIINDYENIGEKIDIIVDEMKDRLLLEFVDNGSSKKFVRKTKKDQ